MPRSQQQEQLTALLFYTLILLLGYLVFRILSPFLSPLGWAGVLAVVFNPVHARIARRLGPSKAAAVSTLAVALLLILPGLALAAAFARQAAQATSQLTDAMTEERMAEVGRLWTWIQNVTIGRVKLDLVSLAQQSAAAVAAWIAGQAGAIVRNVLLFIVNLFIALFALFFLFRDGPAFMQALRRILPVAEAQRERMIQQARDLINATVTSSFIVAAVQGCLGGVTFALLGVSASLFWGVLMAFCALLPVGSGIVWLPMAIWFLATGQIVQGIVLIGVGVGIIGLVDNFLRPLLLSGRSQLNGLLVFVSLVGGIAVFGLLGMVLGPVVVATAVGLLEAHSQEPATDTPTSQG